MSLFGLPSILKWGLRPYEVRGVLEDGRVGCGLSWSTPEMAADLRAGRGNPGAFTRILTVEPVQRGSASASLAGVPEWFFDMIEAQDRRHNGGPSLSY